MNLLHTKQMLFHIDIKMEPFWREDDDSFLEEIICQSGEDTEYDGSQYLSDTGEGDADLSSQMAAQDDTAEVSIEIRTYIYMYNFIMNSYKCSTCMKWLFLQASGSRKPKRKRG